MTRSNSVGGGRPTCRVSRRHLVRVGATTVAGGLLVPILERLVGVGESAVAGPALTELRVGISVDPGTPGYPLLISGGLTGLSQSINHVTETLIIRDEHMRPAPGLAERWEQLDPTTLRLFLRRGVRFHNGEPFDAQSVKQTLDTILAPRSRSVWKGQIQAIKDVVVVNPFTVDVKTSAPYRPLVRMIANAPILPARALEQQGEHLATTPIGTGPFKSLEYVPGDHWTMVVNPDYWGAKPKLQRVTWKYIKDDNARVSALLAGDVDVINNLPPDRISRVRQDARLTAQSVISTFIIYVGCRTDRPPLTDQRVRAALNYAVDKKAIVQKILSGAGEVSDSPLAPTLPYRQSFAPWPYDPDKAQALLRQAGYDRNAARPVLFGTAVGRYIKDREIGEAVSGYLDAVGFKHRLEAPDFPTYLAEVSGGGTNKYDMFLLGYGPQSIEPDQLLSFGFESRPNLNASAYKNPQVDALLEQARATFDEARLKTLYRNVTRIIWFDAPWIWLHYQPEITGFATALKGYGPRADSFWYVARAAWS
jgi:peptide/nickel transport system substrate-binding protein